MLAIAHVNWIRMLIMSEKGVLAYLSLPNVPKTAHLAVKTQGDSAIAIPLGAHMLIVQADNISDDRTSQSAGLGTNAVPVILRSVSFREIVFGCGCGLPNCTRQVIFRGNWTGRHPEISQG